MNINLDEKAIKYLKDNNLRVFLWYDYSINGHLISESLSIRDK